MAEAPHVDVEVRADYYQDDFMAVLAEIRPHWKKEEVVFKRSPKEVDRGLLNTMVRCHRNNDKIDDVIMLRIVNGNWNFMMDRAVEISCIKYLHPLDCAPKILATFKTGYCYEYIKGEVLNHLKIRKDPIWRRVAEELAKIHSADISKVPHFTKNIRFLEMMEKFQDQYPDELKDPEKNERVKKNLPDKATLKREGDETLAHALSFEPDLVLSHNDTRAENIIWNEELGVAKFVDFEGVSYNYRAWEIANHFQRFAGLKDFDLSLIPDEAFQLAWLRVYYEKYYEMIGRRRSDVTDSDVRRLYVQVQKFHLMGLIAMGLGGPAFDDMMEEMMPENTIDMISWAISAVNEFYRIKEKIFALQLPPAST